MLVGVLISNEMSPQKACLCASQIHCRRISIASKLGTPQVFQLINHIVPPYLPIALPLGVHGGRLTPTEDVMEANIVL